MDPASVSSVILSWPGIDNAAATQNAINAIARTRNGSMLTSLEGSWQFSSQLINYANLNGGPVPASAYYFGAHQLSACLGTGTNVPSGFNTAQCSTIVDDLYLPYLAMPTEFRDLDPAWATCQLLPTLYDPPHVLNPTTLDAPTITWNTPDTTSTAVPSASATPTTAVQTAGAWSASPPTTSTRPSSTATADPETLYSSSQGGTTSEDGTTYGSPQSSVKHTSAVAASIQATPSSPAGSSESEGISPTTLASSDPTDTGPPVFSSSMKQSSAVHGSLATQLGEPDDPQTHPSTTVDDVAPLFSVLTQLIAAKSFAISDPHPVSTEQSRDPQSQSSQQSAVVDPSSVVSRSDTRTLRGLR